MILQQAKNLSNKKAGGSQTNHDNVKDVNNVTTGKIIKPNKNKKSKWPPPTYRRLGFL